MKKRNIWIPITAALLALAAIAAMILVPRLPKDEAAVFPVTMVGYTDYYSGSTESYGMVTTDKVQTLYLSSTQTVTEILSTPVRRSRRAMCSSPTTPPCPTWPWSGRIWPTSSWRWS